MNDHESPRMPLVCIILLNWNQRQLTADCLKSLHSVTHPPFQVVLVDNASTDDSVAFVREHYPEVVILENRENLGFSEGNNVGIRYALAQGADYLLLLNNDTEVAPDFLAELFAVADSASDIGIVGPKMYYYDQPQTIWCAGNKVIWPMGHTIRLQAEEQEMTSRSHEAPQPVDFITACALLIKREVVDKVGILDARYFIYFDEADWCLAAKEIGYRVLYVPTARIWHKVSASMGATSPATDYYMDRNSLLFVAKRRRGLQKWHSLLLITGRHLLTVAAYTVKPHGGQRIPNRNARLLALRDAILGRWGKMGPDVATVCYPDR